MSNRDRPGRSINKPSRAEKALRGSEERFRHVAEISHEWIWEVDPRGYYTYSNPAVKDILGYELVEVVGKHWLQFIAPEEKELRRARAQEVAARKKIFFRSTVKKTHKDGRTVVVSSTGGPILDAEGNRLGYRGVDEDITHRKQVEDALQKANAELELRVEERTTELATANEQLEHDMAERKRAEKALRESEQKYRRLVQDSVDGIAIVQGLEARFANRALLEMYGAESEDEVVGRPFTDFVSPAQRELMAERARARQAGERVPAQYEWKALRKDGTEFDAEISVSRITYQGMPAVQAVVRDITERKRMEEALSATTEEYIAITNLTGDIIAKVDEQGTWVFLNDAACQFYGKQREELVGADSRACIHPDDLEASVQAVQNAAATREPIRGFVNRQVTPMGIRVVEWNASPFFNEDGRYAGIQMTGRDVTERQQMDEALRESEERFRSLSASAPIGIFLTGPQGNCIYANPRLQAIAGLTLEESLGYGWTKVIHPDDRQAVLEEVFKARCEGREFSREFRILTGEDEVHWIHVHTRPLSSPQGGQNGSVGTVEDTTERKRAEEALAVKTKEYIDTTNLTADIIAKLDRRGNWVFLNDAACRFYGKPREELLGTDSRAFVHPEDLEATAEAIRETRTKEELVTGFVNRQVVPMGTRVVEWDGYPLFDDEGQYAGIQITGHDITKRKQMEEALRESEARYRLLTENTSDLIWTMDLGLRYTYISPAIKRMRGYTPDEIMDAPITETMTPASVEVARKTLAEQLAIEREENADPNRATKVELEMYCKDGSTIWTEMNMTWLRDSDGKPVGILGVTRDISERKQMEEERERLLAELELRAITDSLTGLYDHAHFYQRLAEEVDRSKRYNHGFALVMMDIDDFKRFNESRGHKVGDEMLRLVARCIPTGLRRSDLAFRYGGDEFAAILPHADPSKARAAVDRINRRIARRLKQMDGDAATELTLTAGVARFPDDGTTADDLVKIADATLYNAKWVARARDIMGQREDIQSLVSALVSRQGGVGGSAGVASFRPEALHEQQARIVSSVASSIAVDLKDAGVAQALEDPDLQVLATVGAAAEIKDRFIRGHPERMSERAVALSEEMGLSPERVRDIRIAALLHDIGKVTVSEGILNKPGKLTRREFESVKDHPIVGAALVSQVRGFERLAKIVRHHHERFDGSGYPDGLAGEDIPPESRVLSVLDVFDALTHQRSYRNALSRDEALAEIERGAGTQFDPLVVKAFLALVKRRARRPAVPA